MTTKKSTTEEKIKFLRECIKNTELADETSILNILNMLGGVNLTDALFEQNTILFTDLMEFLDIKSALKKELSELKIQLATWYLYTILSCRNVGSVQANKIVIVPPLYKTLLINLGLFNINSILNANINNIAISSDIPIVDDAIQIMSYINAPLMQLGNIVKDMYDSNSK